MASSVLLDTCVFLWLELSPSVVPAKLIQLLAEPNDVFLSAASTWEMTIKWTAGKLALPSVPSEFVSVARARSRLKTLAVVEAAVLQTAKLPLLHKDPFDRLLIAQSIEHGLILATPDPLIKQYAVRTIWD
jgi:PIN domain nuclease of toxin-antitoxin system